MLKKVIRGPYDWGWAQTAFGRNLKPNFANPPFSDWGIIDKNSYTLGVLHAKAVPRIYNPESMVDDTVLMAVLAAEKESAETVTPGYVLDQIAQAKSALGVIIGNTSVADDVRGEAQRLLCVAEWSEKDAQAFLALVESISAAKKRAGNDSAEPTG
jgi:hypothetical protein